MDVSWTDPRNVVLAALAAFVLLAWLPPGEPTGAGETAGETLAAVWGAP
jgi:hypothetical protein